jgi:hypothetical protein
MLISELTYWLYGCLQSQSLRREILLMDQQSSSRNLENLRYLNIYSILTEMRAALLNSSYFIKGLVEN